MAGGRVKGSTEMLVLKGMVCALRAALDDETDAGKRRQNRLDLMEKETIPLLK